MRRILTDGGPGTEFWQLFETFERSAWRWEQQPSYWMGYEREQFDRFLAGEVPVTIDFNVHKVGSQLKIRDIVTEGSSLTSNYRSQFRRIIKKKGFDELIKRMKTKLEKDEA